MKKNKPEIVIIDGIEKVKIFSKTRNGKKLEKPFCFYVPLNEYKE